MDAFTLITGLASLFGFAIQVFDLFPKFGRARQTVFLLLVGIFVGSLLRAIDPSSVRFDIRVTGFTIVIVSFALVIVGFLMAAAFSRDIQRRGEFYGVAGIGFLVFIFVLLFGGLMSGAMETPVMEKERITITELNALAEHALQNKNYERALIHLRTIHARVRGDDRANTILEKIRQVELLELQ